MVDIRVIATRLNKLDDYLDLDSRLVHSHLRQRLSDFDQFSRELMDQFPALRGGQEPS